MDSRYVFIEHALQERREQGRLRTPQAVQPEEEHEVDVDGVRCVNFSSNDYLGLSRHPELIRQAGRYAERYGAGSGASRLISGTLTCHEELENDLAAFLGTPQALVFNSGFQANTTIIPTLAGRSTLVLIDRRCHNSLVQGTLLSRGRMERFRHNDTGHLHELLEAHYDRYDRILIITESVFSMDGDRAPLGPVCELAERYQALLMIDDAHAVGVFGSGGTGLTADYPQIDLRMGTFGKAFGVFGAYVGCSEAMKRYLLNFCPGLIYTTSLPPPVIGSIRAAVERMPAMDDERSRVHEKAARVRGQLAGAGLDLSTSDSQIIPVVCGAEQRAVDLSQHLYRQGWFVIPVRPPTVEAGRSRLRITVCSTHRDEQLDALTGAIISWLGS